MTERLDDQDVRVLMQDVAKGVRPRKGFAMAMRWRLMKKGRELYAHSGQPAWGGLRFATAFVLAFFMFGGGIGVYAYTSPEVHMENVLYPLKRTIENVELSIASTPDHKARLYMKMALRRAAEAEVLGQQNAQRNSFVETLQLLEKRVDMSLSTAATEYDPEVANAVLADFERDVETAQKRIQKFTMNEQTGHTTQFMRDRLVRIKKVRGEVNDALSSQKRRVHLGNLKRTLELEQKPTENVNVIEPANVVPEVEVKVNAPDSNNVVMPENIVTPENTVTETVPENNSGVRNNSSNVQQNAQPF